MSVVEPVLVAAALCAFASRKARRDFPAFGAYLACRLGVYGVLALLGARFSLIDAPLASSIHHYVYWVGNLAGAGLALLAVQEVFRHLMDRLPGLGRYGLMAFRWITVTSAMIALWVAVYPSGQHRDLLTAATGAALRCVSILELCLLAFIVFSMQTLRVSSRSREFGVALGLGMVAAADLFGSAFAFRHSAVASFAIYLSHGMIALAAVVWTTYFLQNAPQREPVAATESPRLQRWNEIAGALDEPAPQLSLGASTDFFLQDVEKAVDRVLQKNSVS